MKKLLTVCLTIALILSFCFSTALATAMDDKTDINTYIKDQNGGFINSTEELYVHLMKPDTKSTIIYEKSFEISGKLIDSDLEDVKVRLYKLNQQTGAYEPFVTSEGDSAWSVGGFGWFTRELDLKKGVSKILLVAYQEPKNEALVTGKTLQACFFSIEVMEQSFIDKILKSPKKIIDFFKNL